MTFRDLVLAALAAGDIALDSPTARMALSRADDVGMVVTKADYYARLYSARYGARMPKPKCPQIAAVNLVLHAASETARGVRTV